MRIPAQEIEQFRQSHSGDVITPDDARYDVARRVWNAMIDKRPALIARPRTAVDVSACVRFATGHRLPVAVRGGAHSIAGRGTCDDGIVIDFADMKRITVDPAARHEQRLVEQRREALDPAHCCASHSSASL